MKRLEQGTFERPRQVADNTHIQMDRTELGLLLSGIELKSVRRRKRYQARLVLRANEKPSNN